MADTPGWFDDAGDDEGGYDSAVDLLRNAFVSGLAVVVPGLVTVGVLLFVFDAVYGYVDLFSDVLTRAPGLGAADDATREVVLNALLPVVAVLVVFWVGLFVEVTSYGRTAVDYFDEFVTRVPAVGSVYDSFRQMSDVMLESDAQNFREVKLVEFPHEGAYTLGFVTTETPEALRRPAGHEEMLTLFLPLAPNPVMGGHLVHVPADRVRDVEMSVEEGVRTVVTSGVAVGDGATSAAGRGLSDRRLRELTEIGHVERRVDPAVGPPGVRRTDPVVPDRPETYDRQVDPDYAGTPGGIVRRERPDDPDGASLDERPARRADRDREAREAVDRPARAADRDREAREAVDRPARAADRDREAREAVDRRPAEVPGADDGSDDAGDDR